MAIIKHEPAKAVVSDLWCETNPATLAYIESMTRRRIAKLECNLPSLLLAVSLSRAAHFPLPSVRISDRHYRYVANIAAYV